MRCKLCHCDDMVKATVKKTGKVIAVCVECDCVYELDEHSNPIMDFPQEYISHFREIQKSFRTWDELTDIIPYDKEKEETE